MTILIDRPDAYIQVPNIIILRLTPSIHPNAYNAYNDSSLFIFYIIYVHPTKIKVEVRHIFDPVESDVFTIHRENIQTPEGLQLFELVIKSCRYGGKSAEMSLNFIINTLPKEDVDLDKRIRKFQDEY